MSAPLVESNAFSTSLLFLVLQLCESPKSRHSQGRSLVFALFFRSVSPFRRGFRYGEHLLLRVLTSDDRAERKGFHVTSIVMSYGSGLLQGLCSAATRGTSDLRYVRIQRRGRYNL